MQYINKVKLTIITRLFVLFFVSLLLAQENVHWVKETVYSGPNLENPVNSISYYDGVGTKIQSQAKINSSNQWMVSGGTYQDIMGRDSIVVQPFLKSTFGNFVPLRTEDDDYNILTEANNYYNGSSDIRPDAGDYAFIERIYDVDGSIKKTSNIGEEFALKGTGKHYKKFWKYRVDLDAQSTYLDGNGFFLYEYLNENDLDVIKQADLLARTNIESVKRMVNQQGSGENYNLKDGERIIFKDPPASFGEDSKIFTLVDASSRATWSLVVGKQPAIGDIVFVEYDRSEYEYLGDKKWKKIGLFIPTHYLYITKDENGVYGQEIKDSRGNTIMTCADIIKDGETTPERVISKAVYSIQGQLKESFPPDLEDNPGSSETFKTSMKYNSLGQIVLRRTPDKGTSINSYRKDGLLKYSKDSLCLQYDKNAIINGAQIAEHFYSTEYDELLRVVGINRLFVTWKSNSYFNNPDQEIDQMDIKKTEWISKTIYDKITVSDLQNHCSSFDRDKLLLITNEITNTYGKPVANIGFNHNGTKIVSLVSYNSEGAADKTYLLIPGIPIQKDSVVTKFNGDTEASFHYAGLGNNGVWELGLHKEYFYNSDNRIESVSFNSEKAVEFIYAEDGSLLKKNYYIKDAGVENVLADISFTRNLHGQLKTISSAIFNEEIYYYDTPAGTDFSTLFKANYNGMISGVKYEGTEPNGNPYDHHFSYLYDDFGRLTNVYDGEKGSTIKDFEEVYKYDNMSRLTYKEEGDLKLSAYNYDAKSSKLLTIPNIPEKAGLQDGSIPNYLYDPNGNMVLDRSKKMVIIYNARNLPAIFKLYPAIPETDKNGDHFTWETLGDLDYLTDAQGIRLGRMEVEMIYDASGNRVAKNTYKVDIN